MIHGSSTSFHGRSAAPLACVLALWAVSIVASARADVVPLAPLEARAISDNPSLEAREARVRASAARIEAIRAEMQPRLTLDVGVSASPGAVQEQQCDSNGDGMIVTDPSSPIRDRPCYFRGQAAGGSGADAFLPAVTPNAVVRLEGVLYDFGRTRARTRAGAIDIQAQEAELEAAEGAIVRAVRSAYLNWLAMYERRLGAEHARQVAEERLRDIGGALSSGARSESDRDSAAIEAMRARLEVARALAAEGSARRVVGRVVGEALSDASVPDEALLELSAPTSPTEDAASARALSLHRDVANAARRAYELRHAPILSMSAQAVVAGQFAKDVSPLFIPGYQIQIGLTVPLWDPRARSFVVDEAVAQAQALDAAAEENRITVSLAEDEARRRLADTEEEIRLAEEIVAATERAATGVEQRFRMAGGSIDMVLTANERARRAQEDLLRSRLDRADAVLRLMPVR